MKRIFVILTLSTVFALAGCNNQTQDLPEVSKAHVRITSTVATVTRPEETESESIPEATEEVIIVVQLSRQKSKLFIMN